MNIWIDVDDLFEYAERYARPSGIQRLAFEIYKVLHERFDGEGCIHFVRLDRVHNRFLTVSWQSVAELFQHLSQKDGSVNPHISSTKNWLPKVRRNIPLFLYRIPAPFRSRLANIMRLQVGAVMAVGEFSAFSVRFIAHRMAQSIVSYRRPMTVASNGEFQKLVRAGDIILAMGTGWSYPGYAGLIKACKDRFDVKFGLLTYDIIPLRHPEWCDQNLVRLFRSWFMALVPLADFIFAISRYTADDIVRYAAQSAIPLREQPIAIPIGTGFTPDAATPSPKPADFPKPSSYVLFVSTIEARKNHTLLFRVWRQLLEDMPSSKVPRLVFAGRTGWLVADLMQQLESTDYLDHHIMVMDGLSDGNLEDLYRGCLFTVFPSFYEGWGLPVTESLAFGKPCIASNRTSIPEAGGQFCRYFNPDDLNDAYRVIRGTIEDPDGLSAWEAAIKRDFRVVGWDASADAILRGFGMVSPLQSDTPSDHTQPGFIRDAMLPRPPAGEP